MPPKKIKQQDSDDDAWEPSDSEDARPIKRRKGISIIIPARPKVEATPTLSLQPLLDVLESEVAQSPGGASDEHAFDEIIEKHLEEYLEHRQAYIDAHAELGLSGYNLRSLTRHERVTVLKSIADDLQNLAQALNKPMSRLLARKLKLDILRNANRVTTPLRNFQNSETSKGIAVASSQTNQPNEAVINALESITTTSFSNSFLSRIMGCADHEKKRILARDWDTTSQWMQLMCDVREHHSLMHPDREQPVYAKAPIDYQTLQPQHLTQVHDLLARAFWPGIDVSDSFNYSPEQCTVVATYKRLVVGAAFISSPNETYITYLVVRTGWESSQIATKMLFHLLERNPKKDILLHVSANNPAMLLYNRFGFKAEEFIVGFYEDYLDKHSRSSCNAFRLRLRR